MPLNMGADSSYILNVTDKTGKRVDKETDGLIHIYNPTYHTL